MGCPARNKNGAACGNWQSRRMSDGLWYCHLHGPEDPPAPVELEAVYARLREHGPFNHGEHVVNYLQKERREGRL